MKANLEKYYVDGGDMLETKVLFLVVEGGGQEHKILSPLCENSLKKKCYWAASYRWGSFY